MHYTENDLNYSLKNYAFIKCNKQKTVFYNNKKGRYLKSTKNGRSYGIWIGKKWLTDSKIEIVEKIDNSDMSDDCKHFLSQF